VGHGGAGCGADGEGSYLIRADSGIKGFYMKHPRDKSRLVSLGAHIITCKYKA
jgi:hypothetical protein